MSNKVFNSKVFLMKGGVYQRLKVTDLHLFWTNAQNPCFYIYFEFAMSFDVKIYLFYCFWIKLTPFRAFTHVSYYDAASLAHVAGLETHICCINLHDFRRCSIKKRSHDSVNFFEIFLLFFIFRSAFSLLG
jgi:hypothetical protein